MNTALNSTSLGPSGPALLFAIRQVLVALTALVLTGLVCASVCWTCGYAYGHRRDLTGWIPRPAPRDPVAREAARGVREIERYLALPSPSRRRYRR